MIELKKFISTVMAVLIFSLFFRSQKVSSCRIQAKMRYVVTKRSDFYKIMSRFPSSTNTGPIKASSLLYYYVNKVEIAIC